MHCLNVFLEVEVVTGVNQEGGRDEAMAKKDNGVRKKVMSAEEEALRARSWTVNAMEGAVTRAKELFLRSSMPLNVSFQ